MLTNLLKIYDFSIAGKRWKQSLLLTFCHSPFYNKQMVILVMLIVVNGQLII